jgi:hypothetical protein
MDDHIHQNVFHSSLIISGTKALNYLEALQGELREEFVDFSFAFLYPPAIKFPTFFPWREDIRRF